MENPVLAAQKLRYRIQLETAKLLGWEPFGTHVDDPNVVLDFAGVGEDGLPLFEKERDNG